MSEQRHAHTAGQQGAIKSHPLQTESAEAGATDLSIKPGWEGRHGLHGCLHGRACVNSYDSEPRHNTQEHEKKKNLTGCDVSLELEEKMFFTYKRE